MIAFRFGCLQDAWSFCQNVFPRHNDQHHYSGIGMMKAWSQQPAKVGNGLPMSPAPLTRNASFARRQTPPPLPKEAWINKLIGSDENAH